MAGVKFPGQAKTTAEAIGRARFRNVAQNKTNDDKKTSASVENAKPTAVGGGSGKVPASVNTSGQKTDSRPSSVSDENNLILEPRSNPLGDYSSYTYEITLYMSTPEAVNDFVTSGQFDPRQDHYIVAQSGGIGLEQKRGLTNSGELGPGQMRLDYYIDNFELKIVLTGSEGTPTVGTDISFNIVEPIGFNFFNQLSEISGQLNELSDIIKQSPDVRPAPLRQNYLIGIRFYGYDAAGNLVTTNDFQKNNFYKNRQKELKSAINDYATYERFFTFNITEATYQLDGKVVTYHITGAPVAKQIGHGTKFGLVKSLSTIVAGTVEEALSGTGTTGSNAGRSLMQILDEQNEAEKKSDRASKKLAGITYAIEWGSGTEKLRKSKIIDDASYKNMTPGSNAKSPTQVTPKAQQQAQSINVNKRQITVKDGTSVIQIMDQIMGKSTYVTDVLTMQNNQEIETGSTPNSSNVELSWYSINPIVKIGPRDPITKDWTYNITYRIDVQKIDYVRSLYVRRTNRWSGAHKRYDFFYTGQNTEILNFEQKYQNQFYILQAMSTNSAIINERIKTPAHAQGGTQAKPIASQANRGSDVAGNVVASVNSPADQATASVKIMGDPDFLMSNIGGIQTQNSEIFSDMYNTSLQTMNPYKNQIWIQIVFKGADDYKQDGTLNLKPVDFYGVIDPKNPLQQQLKIEGIIYRVIEVTNSFRGGQFTQNLELILVGLNDLNLKKFEDKIDGEKRETSETQNSSKIPIPMSERERSKLMEANQAPQGGPPGFSIAAGVNAALNPRPPGPDATLPQLQSSPAYVNARREGKSAREALEIAKKIYGVPATTYNTADDDKENSLEIQRLRAREVPGTMVSNEKLRKEYDEDIDRRLRERAVQQRDNPRSIYGNRNPINSSGRGGG